MDIDEALAKMTVTEKLQAMEQLWESLSKDSNTSSPDWHQSIVHARQTKFQDGTAQAISLIDMKDRVAKRQ